MNSPYTSPHSRHRFASDPGVITQYRIVTGQTWFLADSLQEAHDTISTLRLAVPGRRVTVQKRQVMTSPWEFVAVDDD